MQRHTWVLVAAAWFVSAGALLLPAAELKAFFDGYASSGSSYFFTLEICSVLRNALVSAGPAATIAAWAWRRIPRSDARTPADPERGPRGKFALVQVLWVLGLLGTGLAQLRADPPVTKDTKFYLSESLEMAREGGLAAFPARCFTGDYLADNRHPLYPGVLSLVAEESDRFSDRARLFSLAGAALALWLAASWMRRVWGDSGGLLGGLLLVTNGVFLEQSRLVACESWLMAFAVPWFFLVSRERDEHRLRSLGLAGVLAGLLWLTKGTGTLFLAATLVGLAIDRRAGFWRPLGVFAAAFMVTALPLLWRNVKVFGNPFYNLNSSHVFWLDQWEQFHDTATLHSAGLRTWLSTHDFGDFVSRLALGGFKQAIGLLEVFSPWDPSLGLGLPLLALSVVCAACDPSRRRRWLWFTLFGLYYASFSWYAKVVAGPRFLAALIPILLVPIAVLGTTCFGSRLRRRALWTAAAAAGIGMIVLGLARGAGAWRPGRFVPLPVTEEVHAFLLEHVGLREDVHYLLGPSDHFTFDWDSDIRGTRHSFPRDEPALHRLLASHDGPKVRWALVGRTDPSRRSRVESRWVGAEPEGTLTVADPPPEWELVHRIPEQRPVVLVFGRRGDVTQPR